MNDEKSGDDPSLDYNVQDLLRETRDIVSRVLQTIEESSLYKKPDSLMRNLHKQARELVGFKGPADRIVGLVGESGVGTYHLPPFNFVYAD